MLYRERLTVPWVWWLLAGLFALTLLTAVGLYLGPWWGAGVTLTALAAAAGLFGSLAVVVAVDPYELRVGRSVLELAYLGAAEPLDAPQTARRAGVEADARAHLVLRSYVSTAVQLTLEDPADPTPYWLVSTRRPTELAAAVNSARTAVAG